MTGAPTDGPEGLAEPDLAGPQAPVSVAPAPAAGHPVLDDSQRLLLHAVLNDIVPPRGELPGAGDLNVGASIEHTLAASPRLRRVFLDGLADLSILQFIDLPAPSRVDTLRRVEQRQPVFFAALVEHTYRGYYTLPEVHAAIGYVGPPQPNGGSLPAFNVDLLEIQRRRPPFWRRI